MLQWCPAVNVERPADVQTDEPISADARFCCLRVRIEGALGPNDRTRQGQVDEEVSEAVVGHVEVADGCSAGDAPGEPIVECELGLLQLRDAVLRVLEVEAMVKAADAEFEKETGVGIGADDGQEFAGVRDETAGAAADGHVSHLALIVDELACGGQEI